MKKLLFNTAMSLLLLTTITNKVQAQTSDSSGPEISYEKLSDTTLGTAREELASLGYTMETMNELFGDENLFFPTTEEELELSFYIVELVIKNQQFEASDRTHLEQLVKDAFTVYTQISGVTEIK